MDGALLRLRAAVQPQQGGQRAERRARPEQPPGQGEPVLGAERVQRGRDEIGLRRFGGQQRHGFGGAVEREVRDPRRHGRTLAADQHAVAGTGERQAGDDVARRRRQRLDVPGAQVQQLGLAAPVDVPHQRGPRARRVERDHVEVAVVPLGDREHRGHTRRAPQRDGQQRGPLPSGVGVHVELAAGDAEPGVGDQRLAAGDELGAPPGAQVDQLQVAGAAAAQPDHRAPPVARHRAHPRGGPGREHGGRAVADVDEAGLTVAAALGEDGDPDHAAGGRPGAEGGRGGTRRQVTDLAGGRDRRGARRCARRRAGRPAGRSTRRPGDQASAVTSASRVSGRSGSLTMSDGSRSASHARGRPSASAIQASRGAVGRGRRRRCTRPARAGRRAVR